MWIQHDSCGVAGRGVHAHAPVIYTACCAGASRGLLRVCVDRVHRGPTMTVDVTWLKPGSGERWWEAKWTPWKLQAAGKGARKGSRPWTTDGVEADAVQVGPALLHDCRPH